MAIQIANFVSGRLGNVVFYQLQGKYVARTVPSKVRLSKNTKKRNASFGIASSTGCRLRWGLGSVLPFPRELNAQRRFSGAIYKWLGKKALSELLSSDNLHSIINFDFVEDVSFSDRFKVPLQIIQSAENAMELKIPEFIPKTAIAAPNKTVSVKVSFALTACTLKDNVTQTPQIVELEIPFDSALQPSRTIVLPFEPMGDLLMLTLGAVVFNLEGNKTCEKRNYLPCSVIDARYFK